MRILPPAPILAKPLFQKMDVWGTEWINWFNQVANVLNGRVSWVGISSFGASWASAATAGPAWAGGPPSFAIGPTGVVCFRGDLYKTVANAAVGEVLFTLPVGYRPQYNCHLATLVGGPSIVRVTVQPDGSVVLNSTITSAQPILELGPLAFVAV